MAYAELLLGSALSLSPFFTGHMCTHSGQITQPVHCKPVNGLCWMSMDIRWNAAKPRAAGASRKLVIPLWPPFSLLSSCQRPDPGLLQSRLNPPCFAAVALPKAPATLYRWCQVAQTRPAVQLRENIDARSSLVKGPCNSRGPDPMREYCCRKGYSLAHRRAQKAPSSCGPHLKCGVRCFRVPQHDRRESFVNILAITGLSSRSTQGIIAIHKLRR